MPKILLIQPSQYGSHGELIKQKQIYLPGLVFPLLAALTPKHWNVEVKLEVVDEIQFDTDADIVGIGAMGHAIFRAFDLAREFKKAGKKIFLGGYMASLVPDYALQFVDSVIIGDAERSYLKLLKDYELSNEIKAIYNDQIDNLNALPIPKYEVLLDKKIGNMLPVQAGRGCPHSCSFCSIACLYKGKYMTRPVDEVMKDIHRIKELGFKKFYLIDDNIVGNPHYLEELCKRIKPLKMKWATQCTMNLAKNKKLLDQVVESGCRILSLGIESITQNGLDKMNKAWLKVEEHEELIKVFKEAGIMISAEMIIGTDSDTEASLKSTLQFIRKNRIPLLRIYILTPVVGTELYNQLKKDGRLIHENFKLYTASNVVHYPEKISPEKLSEMYLRMNKNVFSISNILYRTILNREFLKRPLEYLFAFGVNLHYRKYIRNENLPIIV